jgi:hypothetical protein
MFGHHYPPAFEVFAGDAFDLAVAGVFDHGLSAFCEVEHVDEGLLIGQVQAGF